MSEQQHWIIYELNDDGSSQTIAYFKNEADAQEVKRQHYNYHWYGIRKATRVHVFDSVEEYNNYFTRQELTSGLDKLTASELAALREHILTNGGHS